MKVFIIIISLLSLNLYASDYCYTQGDCQKLAPTTPATKCFIVNTGFDPFGNKTCAIRCLTVELGKYCHFLQDEVFGICRDEKMPLMPVLNPSDPDKCKDAVDIF